MASTANYAPGDFRHLTFHDAVPRFVDGTDNPRAYLERCLETIEAREPIVRGWAHLAPDLARASADEATERYRAGRPLSLIDGMPIGVKDLFETRDMPTQMGSEAFAGNFPRRDSPSIRALREAGAVIVGKTVTTELGMAHPGPTTNPFHPDHTPGGSSSGSGAVIGAQMVPAAIGSQVGGSLIRPASYCANFGLKPTLGAINRGERMGLSQATMGVHAGSVEDMWQVAIEMVKRAGGDVGQPGLYGPSEPPAPRRPDTLIVLETEGWALLDSASVEAAERYLSNLSRAGVRLLRRSDHPLIEDFERTIAAAKAITNDINSFEMRWNTLNLFEQYPDKLSERILARMRSGQVISLDTYRHLLSQREVGRQKLAALAHLADGLIGVSATGPAPVWERDRPGAPLPKAPTGDYACNAATSLLGAPAVTVPVLGVRGLPLGMQIVGQPHDDARITAIAAWAVKTVAPVSVD
ncbi:MAG: amidase [Phreatobacter sp.]|uniref:amidase n=1 Tax=Phreatobacter sp. TaxID=1966341 RepID=UPI002732F2EF|nr:amidase [Phreatobacter sp.]MDP2801851.1 amidase [Phreatobacter sp.]